MPNRKKIVAANWKMNMTQAEAAAFIDTFLREMGESAEVEVVIIPPFTALSKASEALHDSQNVKLGAQNMYWEKGGAFTGEISAAMLRELFVRYVVRSEEHTSELQSRQYLVCRLLLEKKKKPQWKASPSTRGIPGRR